MEWYNILMLIGIPSIICVIFSSFWTKIMSRAEKRQKEEEEKEAKLKMILCYSRKQIRLSYKHNYMRWAIGLRNKNTLLCWKRLVTKNFIIVIINLVKMGL